MYEKSLNNSNRAVNLGLDMSAKQYTNSVKLVGRYFSSHQKKIVQELLKPLNENLLRRLFFICHYDFSLKPKMMQSSDVLTSSQSAQLFVHLLEATIQLLKEHCSFIAHCIKSDEGGNVVESYCRLWKQYSAALISVDVKF